ncbi:MAG TPA: hypothetical protein VLD86_17130, partial [Ilumatobacteraceae bacterium]|nr:hypothetical protein [Ilumatobacteraceae bacterium]
LGSACHDRGVEQLEFWPEYNAGPLWNSNGESVVLDSLALPDSLRHRLVGWNGRYDDSLLPFEDNDLPWLIEGRSLLAETRTALAGEYEVVVTEPWWGEQPHA